MAFLCPTDRAENAAPALRGGIILKTSIRVCLLNIVFVDLFFGLLLLLAVEFAFIGIHLSYSCVFRNASK